MPARKHPKTLETSSLECIGEDIFLATICQIVRNILGLYFEEYFKNTLLDSKYSRGELKDLFAKYGLLEFSLNAFGKFDKVRQECKSTIKVRAMHMIEDAVLTLQNCFFLETAHYFHAHIVRECIVSINSNTRTNI